MTFPIKIPVRLLLRFFGKLCDLMLASLFQFSFLCVVALANLCLGFAIASRLGWGRALSALLDFSQAAHDDLATYDGPIAEEEPQAPASIG